MLRTAIRLLCLVLLSHGASAQTLDQSQEQKDIGQEIHDIYRLWQTFTPGVSDVLHSVDVRVGVDCLFPPCVDLSSLVLQVLTTSGGVPTQTVLGSAVVQASAAPASPDWVTFDFSAQSIPLTAGTQYALYLASPGTQAAGTAWFWDLQSAGNVYGGGSVFWDPVPGNGVWEPEIGPFAGADATFRTRMGVPEVCGDGAEEPPEECDDGNTASGDGCSAACITETCGDGVVNAVVETCDDGNTAAGDGCSATCTLESTAIACQSALAKAGRLYTAARETAIAKCRLAIVSGKPRSVATPHACATETAAAKGIARAAAQARKIVAGGAKPKCTDALVAGLGLCAETVDALVGPDGATGCLHAELDATVDAELRATFGF
jgi:cysteine-rich repeat protein